MRRISVCMGMGAAACLVFASGARAGSSSTSASDTTSDQSTTTSPGTSSQGSGSSYQGSGSSAPHKMGQDQGKSVQGRVTNVDSDQHELTLSGGQHLKADPSASVTKGGKTASFNDIQEGDQVRASMSPDNTDTVVHIIVIQPEGAQ